MRSFSPLLLAVFVCIASIGAAGELPDSPTTQQVEFFESRIRPILVEHCYACHSADADEVQGGLMFDNRAAIRRGGQTGPVAVTGQPSESRLIVALRFESDELQMPPDGKLPDEVIADFEQWIEMGLPDPRSGAAPVPAGSIQARAENHWAFVTPRRHAPPDVRRTDWAQDPIDRIVLARLEEAGLAPAADAAPDKLIRRLAFDVTGLPPWYDDVVEFVGQWNVAGTVSERDAVYSRLVDRLLATPAFGERWARHWLDLARFGDTKGYVFTQDRNYPNAYMYRDWVIRAFNEDMPYDAFLKYQIAADHIVSDDQREHLAALGYLTLGRRFINNMHDIIDDRIDVMSRGMMGLTISCARCHDHKYDPISAKDYYALYGVFRSSSELQEDNLPLRLVDSERPEDARILLRGNASNPGDVARRGFVTFLANENSAEFKRGSGRLDLAEAIADANNPLTARVFVNRVWMHLFGEGLVATPSDFGLRSDRPEYAEVLDELACGLVEHSWSMKHLVRRIVMSKVYRQSSVGSPLAIEVDPENRLLARANRRRLDFEALRDSLLVAAHSLDRSVGGPSVTIESVPTPRRRTLYAFVDRQNLPSLFRTFDFASPDTHSPQRPQTTVPQQALYLMNNPGVQQLFAATAERSAAVISARNRIQLMYRQILGRDPELRESDLGLAFVEKATLSDRQGSDGFGPWQHMAQTLMLTNEFMFLD